jgi:serine/threonine-protein kinase
MDKYIGRLLDNRYEILEVIGSGGMAVVYKARCHRLNRLVAIKILKDDNLQDEDFRRRFHAESQAVAMLSHPNIVSIYDVSTSIMADYIVMELIEGITLKQYMEKKGTLNWKETLHFAMQIAKALEHAHSRGIVHRDIKPHNVMVLKNGSVKVMDFGIARMMSKGNTLTKEALGSVHYISPEQAKGGRVDSRSDLYSLGVVMYEMMTGRPPYDGDSPVSVAIQHINGGAVMPSTLNPNIPGGLEQIIMKAMAHEIEGRYASAQQMLSDMDEFRKDPTILFDYHAPALDVITRVSKPDLVVQPVKTTAERVAKTQDPPQRRTPAGGSAPRNPQPKMPQPKKKPQTPKNKMWEEEEEGRSRIATIAIIACSLVAVMAIVVFLVILLGGSTPNQVLVAVPNLVGEYYEELPDYENFQIIIDPVYDETIEKGKIIEQSPKAGAREPEGTRITIRVSMGPMPEKIKMHDLVNWTQADAEKSLKDLGLNLKVDIRPEASDDIPKGCVIRTEPAVGKELSTAQTVVVWVSSGYEIKTGAMPNIVGEMKDVAIKTLEGQGLHLEIVIEEIYDPELAGRVLSATPEKDAILTTGDTVTLVVSLGPELATIPNMIGWNYDMAIRYLITSGFKTPEIQIVASNMPVDTVVGQSETEETQIDINTRIVLQVSGGPDYVQPSAGRNVEISLQGLTAEGLCGVRIVRNGEDVYNNPSVAAGTASITLKNQKGFGTVEYEVTVTQNGEIVGTWIERVSFNDGN